MGSNCEKRAPSSDSKPLSTGAGSSSPVSVIIDVSAHSTLAPPGTPATAGVREEGAGREDEEEDAVSLEPEGGGETKGAARARTRLGGEDEEPVGTEEELTDPASTCAETRSSSGACSRLVCIRTVPRSGRTVHHSGQTVPHQGTGRQAQERSEPTRGWGAAGRGGARETGKVAELKWPPHRVAHGASRLSAWPLELCT